MVISSVCFEYCKVTAIVNAAAALPNILPFSDANGIVRNHFSGSEWSGRYVRFPFRVNPWSRS